MFNSALDVLYIAIAVSLFLLTVFICVNLVFTTLILRDIAKASEKIRDTAEKVNHFVTGPIKTWQNCADYLRRLIEVFFERFFTKREEGEAEKEEEKKD